ncbi:MAG: bifunctional demethylmenaquinone methyltransferase/2-methoxy-6-polyprenyl-1,4-benzoquinol methylase UbiE [Simkaniaceae bacterium]
MMVSRKNVREMFDTISGRYDLINRILSFGLDKKWRRRLFNSLPKAPFDLLDLATGTGDQVISFFELNAPIKQAIGIDISLKMLEVGKQKIEKRNLSSKVQFLEGDALDIPLDDGSVDVVTISFGIRNVEDVDRCLSEIYRVLRPNGCLLILEFSQVTNPFFRIGHKFYLRHILPKVGGFLSKQKSAYRYLNQTIETFPFGANFCKLLEKANFSKITFTPFTLGSVTLYKGEKNAP